MKILFKGLQSKYGIMDKETLELIKKNIEEIEAGGHGEVVVKIKNGFVFRILITQDKLLVK